MASRVALALGVMLLCRGSVRGQAVETDQPRRILQAVRVNGASVKIDGVLDESAWNLARPAGDFVQRDPDNGAPATEQTEVRILYDADRLILGVTCKDAEPDRLLGNQMQRDQTFAADDRFMWAIDTFLDGRSGYYFEINPAGAMGDGLVNPSSQDDLLGADVNRSWDGIWTARVRRTSGGWSAEIEIPFRTLNFDAGAEAWGINFQRTIRRKNEETLWTGHLRNQGLTRMSGAGRLEGLRDISQGLGLDLKPYAVGTLSAAPGRERETSIAAGDIGLDAFYNFTPALRANLSVNTDFAETEVDQRQVNLTRFPLFFEEKRDFFLEGSNYFDFARENGQAIVPFFSRRIGLDAQGTPQRIDFGAKLTGQAGAFDVGLLQVRTGETGMQAGDHFSVVRLRRRMFQQSFAGVLYTLRAGRATGATDLHTAGLDFALRSSTFRGNQTAELSGYYLWTSNPLGNGESAAFGFRFLAPNDPFRLNVAVRELQPNYSPAVGFLQRTGYRRANPEVGYTWRLQDHPLIRSFDFEADLEFINDTRNRPLTRQLEFKVLEVNFHDGSQVSAQVAPNYERLDEDFEISDGVVLPVGNTYTFTRYQLQGSTAERRVVSIGTSVEFGDFFSGRRREQTLVVGIRPRRGVAITLEAERNVLDLAEGSFSTDVVRARANTQLSPWIAVVNNVQYDTVSRLLGYQMRFRWTRRPGNDLYVVYTHNWQENLESSRGGFATLDTRLATKLVYTLRF